MQVRSAVPTDIPAIARIELSAGELFQNTHMDWAAGETTDPAKLLRAIADNNVLIAVVAETPAGFLLADICDNNFHICEVAVDQQFRGKRVGVALLETGLFEARNRGYAFASLTTDRALPWNATYYESLGFRILAPDETPPELAIILAGEPNPHLRCAMLRPL